MKMLKISSVLILVAFIFCAFVPEASARNHHRCKHKSRSYFGLGFNFAPSPNYVVAPAPVPVMPYRAAVVPAPVYGYPGYYAPAPVYVDPAPVYVQPSFSFSYGFRR